MTHLHKASGQTFEVGEYRDGDKTYDIQVISYWKDAETQGIGSPVEIVGYYFGGYDEKDTDFYIDKWIANREKEINTLDTALKYMNAYLTVNEDVMERLDVGILQECIVNCQDLLYDRSWKLEGNLPPAFKMNRAEYIRFINVLLQNGEIDEKAADTLLELQINYQD